ncbi:MAG: dynamin family protein [Armatimonadota bacterium]
MAVSETQTEALSDTLGELAQFARERGNDGNARRLEELIAKLEAQTFNLVVFGEFKRGKTTFINALIGQELLPAAVVPLTSVVTILHYGPMTQAQVEFRDGRTEVIPTERLADYVTERGNPHNVRQVRLVRVAVPSPLLRNGMQLVDTPGVGSVYDHNTEATRDFLPHVDGAILLVASDPPISRGECEFLMEMRPHVARLFVVQNKIDLLRPAEAAESLEFTEGILCEVLGRGEVEVFALSAREALEAQLDGDARRLTESGLPLFVEELRRFQEHEQAETLVLSVVRNALEVAEDEALGLDLERQAMHMSLAEIEARSSDFRRRRDQLLAQREDDTILIRAAARKLIAHTLERDYQQERKGRIPELRRRFAQWAESEQGLSADRLVQAGNDFVRETLYAVLNEWRQVEEKRLEQELGDTLERFTARANEALSAIYDLAREVFELPPRSVETVGYLAAPSQFRWQDWRWEVRPGVSGSALARWLLGARGRMLQAIETKLLDEHDKACGRLRHDFAERAQAGFDDYANSVTRSLDEAIAGIDRAIERAIAQKHRTSEQAEETEQRVAAQSERLRRLIAALQSAQRAEGVEDAAPAAC